MNECAKCRGLMAEALYDDLSPKDRAAFEAHLTRCGACADEYAAMTETRKMLYARERSDPGPEFWEGYWDRLEKRLDAEPAPRPARGWAHRPFTFFPAWAFRAAAAAALLVVGIFIGRTLLRPPAPRVVRATPPAVAPVPGVEQASAPVLRARDYFERSKLILLGIVNYDPGASDVYGLDLPQQKQLSRALVNEAGSLQNDLKAPAQKRLRELVADLETILVQIANLESANDLDAVELVKNGVAEKGIFLKINLTEMGPSPKARTDKSPM